MRDESGRLRNALSKAKAEANGFSVQLDDARGKIRQLEGQLSELEREKTLGLCATTVNN
jgi:hypothetical protein